MRRKRLPKSAVITGFHLSLPLVTLLPLRRMNRMNSHQNPSENRVRLLLLRGGLGTRLREETLLHCSQQCTLNGGLGPIVPCGREALQ